MNFRPNQFALILMLATVGTVSMCRSEQPSTPGLMKRTDVKRLLKSAHTREQFAQLAAYFDERSQGFKQKAREEDMELYRLNNATFRAKNFPILVDRARNSAEYDRSEAKKSAEEAMAFQQKAEGASTGQSSVAGRQYE